MPTRRSFLAAGTAGLAACTLPLAAQAPATLRPYRDEAELMAALGRWRTEAARLQAPRHRALGASPVAPSAAPQADMVAKAAAPAAMAAQESITNVQTAGVDEGGIVKRAGDFLVILRRGRLFTVRVGGDALQPVGSTDAFGPGVSPAGAWYDELLVSGRTVVVVGYSYERGGTEIGLFDLRAGGRLRHRATYHLRGNDYYSSRNYASRLVGTRLLFYTPTVLSPWQAEPLAQLPAWRRWGGDALPGEFRRILPATRVYRSDDDFDAAEPLALHTVTEIELGGAEPVVQSTAVLGPVGRVFYVSAGAVYVWTAALRRPDASAVFRLPLDGAAPTALKTAGLPVDQLSFLEDEGGHINVLLRAGGRGEAMWGAESAAGGELALLRVPLAAFGDGRAAAGREHYRRLPAAPAGPLQNRFVGDWLLWGGSGDARAFALRYAGRDAVSRLEAGHAVERIEALGAHALLVGPQGGDLHLSLVRLQGARAALSGVHVQAGVQQGETRTHGFFYRPTGEAEGLVGLPLLGSGARWGRAPAGAAGSASVLVLRQRGGHLAPLGELSASDHEPADDACRASCVDWYGNARPIFLGERVLALMGYELVEARVQHGGARDALKERRRVSFAPGRGDGARYSPFG